MEQVVALAQVPVQVSVPVRERVLVPALVLVSVPAQGLAREPELV